MSVASGPNALARCVDSVDRALRRRGHRALAAGLTASTADPAALKGREQVLYEAYLSAVAFSSADSGPHHKIRHLLGAGTTCRTPAADRTKAS